MAMEYTPPPKAPELDKMEHVNEEAAAESAVLIDIGEGSIDDLSPEDRAKVVKYAKSLRAGLPSDVLIMEKDTKAKAYWEFCRLANSDPKEALKQAHDAQGAYPGLIGLK